MKREYVFAMVLEKDRKLPLLVSGVGCEEFQNHIIRKTGIPLHHLVFCIAGMGTLKIDGKEYQIKNGEAFYFDPDIPHEYYPVEEPWTTLWIVFEGYSVKPILTAAHFGRCDVFPVKNMDEVIKNYNNIYKLISTRPDNYVLEASSSLYNLLTRVGCDSLIEKPDNTAHAYRKLNDVIEYIKVNYKREISLDEMAEIAGVSTSYLCKLFKQAYDMTPFSYIIRYRIYSAKKKLLNYPDKSIKSIAYEIGFNDCSYFGLVFKKMEGYSPNQFRSFYSKEK
ncbi:MAG TPA: AraC family transcriptional regulator [Lachnospiraceae bacterium]|nr:AraC family transcriptional regulator [Lachnospiraceae bacterium]